MNSGHTKVSKYLKWRTTMWPTHCPVQWAPRTSSVGCKDAPLSNAEVTN